MEGPVTVDNLVDLIESGRWKRALFTTYVFSLSFFESVLLRKLREIGCQEIWIISDLHGYKTSLIERRSHAIGREYRLVPVRLPNGVFHPKCLYLEGNDEDALAVGSGNLTFGGFGRNLEVLDVFSSRTSPQIFLEFGDFLASLAGRADFECPDDSWITTFESRAKALGSSENPGAETHLLSSGNRPIIDQLRLLLAETNTLTVMSPFFDEDGYGVKQLAESLGAARIQVAVPSTSSVSNFPFHKAMRWNQAVEAVWPADSDVKRSLHAKWFEFSGSNHRSVMTGSANATRQALCTISNIEVSVLRIGSQDQEWAHWAPSHIPETFEPTPYTRPETSELFAHASLTGDFLQRKVLGFRHHEGAWDGRLTKPSGSTTQFKLDIDEDGRFQVTDREFLQYAFASGVQITLSCRGLYARGWVHAEDVLRMAHIPHLNFGALVRIISLEGTEDDDAALLDYLAISAHKHSHTFLGRIKSVRMNNRNKESDSAFIKVDLEELAPTKGPGSTAWQGTQISSQSLERVIAQLRKRLLGDGLEANGESGDETLAEAESDFANPHEAASEADKHPVPGKPKRRFEKSINLFDRNMRAIADSPGLNPLESRGVLVVWFEVMTRMLLMRLKDKNRALQFMQGWSHIVARRTKSSNEIDSLEQHFVSSIALLESMSVESSTVSHELLERYFEGDVDRARVELALLASQGVLFGLFECDDNSLRTALLKVQESRTLRQEVVSIVTAVRRGEEIDPASPIFKGVAGAIILEELLRLNGQDRFVEQRGDARVCSRSSETLPAIMASSLEHFRIAFHKGWFTVRTIR